MKNLSKIILSFFILMLVCPLLVSTAANPQVVDNAGLLSVDFAASLETNINELKEKIPLDIVVYTTLNTGNKTAVAFADDAFDYGGYGADDGEHSGVLLLIGKEDRYVYISTAGTAIEIFTDAKIDKMLDNMYTYLRYDNYEKAAEVFLKDVEYYYNHANPTLVFRLNYAWGKLFIGIIAGVVIGLVTVLVLANKNRSKMTATYSHYLVGDSFNLMVKNDAFVSTHTSRVKIETSSGGGGGGGSSTHSGSSGRSHGGGGRHF